MCQQNKDNNRAWKSDGDMRFFSLLRTQKFNKQKLGCCQKCHPWGILLLVFLVAMGDWFGAFPLAIGRPLSARTSCTRGLQKALVCKLMEGDSLVLIGFGMTPTLYTLFPPSPTPPCPALPPSPSLPLTV